MKKRTTTTTAILLRKPDGFYCSSCRLRQPRDFTWQCCFCGAEFSNYESTIIELEMDGTFDRQDWEEEEEKGL